MNHEMKIFDCLECYDDENGNYVYFWSDDAFKDDDLDQKIIDDFEKLGVSLFDYGECISVIQTGVNSGIEMMVVGYFLAAAKEKSLEYALVYDDKPDQALLDLLTEYETDCGFETEVGARYCLKPSHILGVLNKEDRDMIINQQYPSGKGALLP